MKNIKILVTGGTGFLGSHLVEELVKRNFFVRCLIRNPKKLKWLENFPVEVVRGDCNDKKSLDPAVSGVDYVIHAAGLVRAIEHKKLYLTNVKGTKNLIESVANINPGIKRFVYISSQAAAGPAVNGGKKAENDIPNPVSHYGLSKLLGEAEVFKFQNKLPVTVLRPPSIYGPRDKDIFVFFKYTKKSFFPIANTEKHFNISFVSDVVNGIIAAMESDKTKGQKYNIGDDTVFSWNSLAETLIKVVNSRAKTIRMPETVFYLSAFFSEIFARLKKDPALFSFDKLNEIKQKDWLFSAKKAKDDFRYEPKIPLEKGIKITYDWYLDKGWL
ncbi:MAG: NAD-dependent epimerase/dehydratase family protein [Elusimicrobia bacterium]|nr:NAD-dependent epimerase/dehydratase family protein [Elusimicrobiota bacterium]